MPASANTNGAPERLLRRIILPSCTQRLRDLRNELRAVLAEIGATAEETHDVVLAAHEAAANAALHGNAGEARRRVSVEVRLAGRHLTIEVADEGPGFDGRAALTRARTRPTPPDALSGRGILVMLHTVDALEYSTSGSVVVLRKQLSDPSAP